MITREVAEKVRDVVDAGLVSGVGVAELGKMCVESAVCYALGLPHGDNPDCVNPVLRAFKIGLNDRSWSSPQARAKGLRRLAVAQLGSAGVCDGHEFRRRIVDLTIRRMVPIGLRAAATRNPKHGDALEAAAVRCETEGTQEACEYARQVARTAADAAYVAYAADAAAADAAYAAAAAAYVANVAYAAAAAADAAAAAAYAADAAAYADAAAADADAARTRDRVLMEYAEQAVQILVEMKAPGCQWLDLVPKER